MTEDEAKARWCPFARPRHAPSNSDADRCIGSACMAWKWRMRQTNEQPYGAGTWPQVKPIYERTDDGYCGLAGGFQ